MNTVIRKSILASAVAGVLVLTGCASTGHYGQKNGANVITGPAVTENPTPYSAALMSKAEETFLTGKAPYPVERTLLTSGLVEAGMKSLASGKRVETPYMNVRYRAPRESTFWQA